MVGKRWIGLWAGVLLLLGTALAARPPAPRSVTGCGDAVYDLIALVNSVRTGAGLPAFTINATLMAVAQGHSEYQAAINQGTHIGPGGSHPRDRVRAAGYGGGRTIFVSENIAWGTNLTPQGAVDMWIPSPPHYRTMTGAQYHDVGAGCARNGNRVYYTLVAAGISGHAPPPTPRPNTTPPTPAQPTPTLPYEPVLPATPRPDGAVIHTVQRGQTLMMIAGSYRVPLEDILRYNHLREDSLLRIGQQLIIVPPQVTPTPTANAEGDLRASTSPTPTVTVTNPAVSPTPAADFAPSPEPTEAAGRATPAPNGPPRWPLPVAAALGLSLALLGYGLARRRNPL